MTTAFLVVPWSWKTFLAPLKSDWKPQPSVRNLDLEGGYPGVRDISCLVDRFRMNLSNQHSQMIIQKNLAVRLASGVVATFLSPLTNFEYFETLWKKYASALNIKSDREKPGSAWTIEMLEKYIQRQDIIFEQPESRFDLTGEVLQKICERVDLSIKAICGWQLPPATVVNLGQIQQHNTTESDTKMILDAILQPLCVSKGLTVRSEQTIKSSELPTNRYDFIMYYNGQPIGVVEAKRRGSLNDQSVPQLLAQLLLLSAGDPNSFYFGLLSDAFLHIFAGVTREKVVFFQANDKLLEIAIVQSDHDLTSIANKISWLANRAIWSRQKPRSQTNPFLKLTSSVPHVG